MKLLNKLFLLLLFPLIFNSAVARDCCIKPKVKGIPFENAYSLESNSVDCLVGKYSLFTRNGKYGVVNSSGKVLIKPIYLGGEVMHEGVFIFKDSDNKLGVVDYKGQNRLPFNFDEIRVNRNNDFAIVSRNGKYGEINFLGKFTIPLQYDGLTYVDKPFLLSYENNKVGLISMQTKTVLVNNEYDVIIPGKTSIDNIAIKNGIAYYINDDGKILSKAPLPPHR